MLIDMVMKEDNQRNYNHKSYLQLSYYFYSLEGYELVYVHYICYNMYIFVKLGFKEENKCELSL